MKLQLCLVLVVLLFVILIATHAAEEIECFGVPANETATVCSGHGECKGSGNETHCQCDSKHGGEECQWAKCSGIEGRLQDNTYIASY
jgi:hypothetical protein